MPHPPRFNTYSDFMAVTGFYRQEQLFAATLAWQTVFDLCKPDLILCDNSPICCLAAFGRIPVVLLGDGFTLPPAHDPIFPPFHDMRSIVDPDLCWEHARYPAAPCRPDSRNHYGTLPHGSETVKYSSGNRSLPDDRRDIVIGPACPMICLNLNPFIRAALLCLS